MVENVHAVLQFLLMTIEQLKLSNQNRGRSYILAIRLEDLLNTIRAKIESFHDTLNSSLQSILSRLKYCVEMSLELVNQTAPSNKSNVFQMAYTMALAKQTSQKFETIHQVLTSCEDDMIITLTLEKNIFSKNWLQLYSDARNADEASLQQESSGIGSIEDQLNSLSEILRQNYITDRENALKRLESRRALIEANKELSNQSYEALDRLYGPIIKEYCKNVLQYHSSMLGIVKQNEIEKVLSNLPISHVYSLLRKDSSSSFEREGANKALSRFMAPGLSSSSSSSSSSSLTQNQELWRSIAASPFMESLVEQLHINTHNSNSGNSNNNSNTTGSDKITQNNTKSVLDAVSTDRWLVILGDPGIGKTSTMRYLCQKMAEAMLKDERTVSIRNELVVVEEGKVKEEENDHDNGNDHKNDTTDMATVVLGPTRVPILIRIGEYASWRKELLSMTNNPDQMSTETEIVTDNDNSNSNSSNTIDTLGSIFQYIGEHTWQGNYYLPQFDKNISKNLQRALQDYVIAGKALIVLDGLDEISDTKQRLDIVGLVEKFVEQHILSPITSLSPFDLDVLKNTSDESPAVGGNQIIVTSRIVGYHAMPLHGYFSHYIIQSMSLDGIKLYLESWFAYMTKVSKTIDNHSHGHGHNHGHGHSKKFVENGTDDLYKIIELSKETASQLFDLASNPLLLNVIATVYVNNNGSLPNQRSSLYEVAVNSTLTLWQSRSSNEIIGDELYYCLSAVAATIHENNSCGLIETNDLKQLLKLAITQYDNMKKNDNNNNNNSNDDVSTMVDSTKLSPDDERADKLIQVIREEAGVMSARGEFVYGFLHLSFQEFFTAMNIVLLSSVSSIKNVPYELATRLLNKITDPRYREVHLLVIGYCNLKWTPGEFEQLLTYLLEQVENILPFGALLVLRSLSEMSYYPSHKIVSKALTDALLSTSMLTTQALKTSSVIVQLKNTLNKMSVSYANNWAQEFMEKNLHDPRNIICFCQSLFLSRKDDKSIDDDIKWLDPTTLTKLCELHKYVNSESYMKYSDWRIALNIVDKTVALILISDPNKFPSDPDENSIRSFFESESTIQDKVVSNPSIMAVIITIFGGVTSNLEFNHLVINRTGFEDKSISLSSMLCSFLSTSDVKDTSILIHQIEKKLLSPMIRNQNKVAVVEAFIALVMLKGMKDVSYYDRIWNNIAGDDPTFYYKLREYCSKSLEYFQELICLSKSMLTWLMNPEFENFFSTNNFDRFYEVSALSSVSSTCGFAMNFENYDFDCSVDKWLSNHLYVSHGIGSNALTRIIKEDEDNNHEFDYENTGFTYNDATLADLTGYYLNDNLDQLPIALQPSYLQPLLHREYSNDNIIVSSSQWKDHIPLSIIYAEALIQLYLAHQYKFIYSFHLLRNLGVLIWKNMPKLIPLYKIVGSKICVDGQFLIEFNNHISKLSQEIMIDESLDIHDEIFCDIICKFYSHPFEYCISEDDLGTLIKMNNSDDVIDEYSIDYYREKFTNSYHREIFTQIPNLPPLYRLYCLALLLSHPFNKCNPMESIFILLERELASILSSSSKSSPFIEIYAIIRNVYALKSYKDCSMYIESILHLSQSWSLEIKKSIAFSLHDFLYTAAGWNLLYIYSQSESNSDDYFAATTLNLNSVIVKDIVEAAYNYIKKLKIAREERQNIHNENDNSEEDDMEETLSYTRCLNCWNIFYSLSVLIDIVKVFENKLYSAVLVEKGMEKSFSENQSLPLRCIHNMIISYDNQSDCVPLTFVTISMLQDILNEGNESVSSSEELDYYLSQLYIIDDFVCVLIRQWLYSPWKRIRLWSAIFLGEYGVFNPTIVELIYECLDCDFMYTTAGKMKIRAENVLIRLTKDQSIGLGSILTLIWYTLTEKYNNAYKSLIFRWALDQVSILEVDIFYLLWAASLSTKKFVIFSDLFQVNYNKILSIVHGKDISLNELIEPSRNRLFDCYIKDCLGSVFAHLLKQSDTNRLILLFRSSLFGDVDSKEVVKWMFSLIETSESEVLKEVVCYSLSGIGDFDQVRNFLNDFIDSSRNIPTIHPTVLSAAIRCYGRLFYLYTPRVMREAALKRLDEYLHHDLEEVKNAALVAICTIISTIEGPAGRYRKYFNDEDYDIIAIYKALIEVTRSIVVSSSLHTRVNNIAQYIDSEPRLLPILVTDLYASLKIYEPESLHVEPISETTHLEATMGYPAFCYVASVYAQKSPSAFTTYVNSTSFRDELVKCLIHGTYQHDFLLRQCCCELLSFLSPLTIEIIHCYIRNIRDVEQVKVAVMKAITRFKYAEDNVFDELVKNISSSDTEVAYISCTLLLQLSLHRVFNMQHAVSVILKEISKQTSKSMNNNMSMLIHGDYNLLYHRNVSGVNMWTKILSSGSFISSMFTLVMEVLDLNGSTLNNSKRENTIVEQKKISLKMLGFHPTNEIYCTFSIGEVKKICVDCVFGDQTSPFALYIGDSVEGFNSVHSLYYQSLWLYLMRGGLVPTPVIDALKQLAVIAKTNNVSFIKLCIYALGSAQQQIDEGIDY